jgi:hypothetical protein
MPRSSEWYFPLRFFHQSSVRISDLSHAYYMPIPYILLDLMASIIYGAPHYVLFSSLSSYVQHSSVGIALSSIPGRGWEFFSSPPRPERLWGPPSLLSNGYIRPGREADSSPPPNADVKNAWSYISTPQYALMAWCSVKALCSLIPSVLHMRNRFSHTHTQNKRSKLQLIHLTFQ